MQPMTTVKTEEAGPAAETNPSLPMPKDVYAAVERLEQVLVRFESLVPTAEKLTLILNDQMDDALELCMRLEAVCDALSRKLFEKAIHEWVEEERQRKESLKSNRSGGGFDLEKTTDGAMKVHG